jgi:AraC family transcriptional regulator
MRSASRTRAIVRRIAGSPIASGRVPARLPLLLERHQALFDSIVVPPLPAPVLMVHTGGKPLAYQSAGRQQSRQSLPGLVTFVPRNVRSQIVLRGVGEGTMIYFGDERGLPAWLDRNPRSDLVTFSNDVIASLTRRLVSEVESGQQARPYLRTLGNALLAELQRELGQQHASIRLPASRGGLRIAHTAIQHMLRNLGEPLPVSELARVCGVGVTSFSSGFREATGLTPHRYLRRARIERSCELLRTTRLSIREVAEVVGFRGQGHFCTVFTRERGITPSAYRRGSGVRAR